MLNIFPIALFLYLATDLKLPLEKAHIKQRNLNEGPFVLDKLSLDCTRTKDWVVLFFFYLSELLYSLLTVLLSSLRLRNV